MKIRKWLLPIPIFLSLAACSRYRDAVVFNPCSEPVSVSFRLRLDSPTGETIQVPSETRKFVGAAFPETEADTVRLDIHVEQNVAQIPVAVTDEEPLPVLIPARACPGGSD
jgi:hypothetical protein